MSYKGITKEDLETMRRNGMSFGEEQQLFWEKEDYLEVDKDKEIERLNKCIKDDKENANEIMAEQQQEIERLNNKIEELELDLQDTNSQLADVSKRCIKTIKYIEDMQKYPNYCDTWSTTAPHDIICILKGSDK